MVATPEMQAPQTRVRVVVKFTTEIMQAPQTRARVPANFPTPEMLSSQASATLVAQPFRPIDASEGRLRVVARGRITNSRIRAWAFTLDGHDFYVLRLGDFETLVYDTHSAQWVVWKTTGLSIWRANTGINWAGAYSYAVVYGSDVVVGDDNSGRLFFLNPMKQTDDFPTEPLQGEIGEANIERIIMGQVVMRRRDNMPCYEVYITGDLESPFAGSGVELLTSPDGGENYYSHGRYGIEDAPDKEFVWRSLGQIEAPGWLFMLKDNGMFVRVDSLDMNDPEQPTDG